MNDCIGKICPFCKTEIEENDTVKICPYCGAPHHADCWEVNRGCSVQGCSKQNRKKQPAIIPVENKKSISKQEKAFSDKTEKPEIINEPRKTADEIPPEKVFFDDLPTKEDEARIESSILAKESIIAAERSAKKRRRIIAVVTPVACIAIAAAVIAAILFVIIPDGNYKKAAALYAEGNYEDAISAFEALNGFKDSAEQIENCRTAINDKKYEDAESLFNEGKYETAISAFEALDGYRDSEKQIEKCRTAISDKEYEAAASLFVKGSYEEAISAFEALKGYKDSEKQIENCRTAINDKDYEAATALVDDGDIIKGYEALVALNGYRDSEAKAEEIRLQYILEKKYPQFAKCSAGETVTFGNYHDSTEWIVLERKDNRFLIISKEGLDAKPYNKEMKDATWETCSLREWLNKDFIDEAFSADEQEVIQEITVKADKNPKHETSPGEDTEDKVFLLSISEINKYFKTDEEKKCVPSEYAKKNNVSTSFSFTVDDKATSWWWLRTPGINNLSTAYADVDGTVNEDGYAVLDERGCVRPALWLNFETSDKT